ncbi:MAG: DUF2490 domain-containing protein [Saprospiraceae bacterium]
MKRVDFWKIGFFVSFFIFGNVVQITAQLDWVSWSSVQLNYKANDRFIIKLKPIWRQKNDLSEYDNSSIDVILSYKINKQWSVDVNNRHWFLPNDGDDREFWFFDLNHKISLSPKFVFSNKLRYHLGVDWNREDTDFLRWLSKISWSTGKKINPFIGWDFFYRFPENNVFARLRYKIGAAATLSNRTKLTVEYWRQFSLTDKFNEPEANFLVVNFAYNLN